MGNINSAEIQNSSSLLSIKDPPIKDEVPKNKTKGCLQFRKKRDRKNQVKLLYEEFIKFRDLILDHMENQNEFRKYVELVVPEWQRLSKLYDSVEVLAQKLRRNRNNFPRGIKGQMICSRCNNRFENISTKNCGRSYRTSRHRGHVICNLCYKKFKKISKRKIHSYYY
ncbi:hypothetical protein JYU34_020110 [Plutella xylostella]|uniref:LIM zinc-binding domain-containing protein n=1 Tax=Plutella xylostella TaxID=51655 RepID=A0ABQ7PZR0_PLUXY|nr:hypothetical protein JYU34_020110 [Plutella xylostella]